MAPHSGVGRDREVGGGGGGEGRPGAGHAPVQSAVSAVHVSSLGLSLKFGGLSKLNNYFSNQSIFILIQIFL